MDRNERNSLITGFVFGSAGMYLLALLALALPFFENLGGFLFSPGRWLADRFAGPEGSDGSVLLITLANGLFYALVFWIVTVFVNLAGPRRKHLQRQSRRHARRDG